MEYDSLLPWVDYMSSTWFQTYVALPEMNEGTRLDKKRGLFSVRRKHYKTMLMLNPGKNDAWTTMKQWMENMRSAQMWKH